MDDAQADIEDRNSSRRRSLERYQPQRNGKEDNPGVMGNQRSPSKGRGRGRGRGRDKQVESCPIAALSNGLKSMTVSNDQYRPHVGADDAKPNKSSCTSFDTPAINTSDNTYFPMTRPHHQDQHVETSGSHGDSMHLQKNRHGNGSSGNFYRQGKKKSYSGNLRGGWGGKQNGSYTFDEKEANRTPIKSDSRQFPKRNTENFNPSHEPPEMRILAAPPGLTRYNREYTTRDVLVVHGLYCEQSDLSIYNALLREIKDSGIQEHDLWQLWHGDSHVIADDKKRWKESCPTFHMVLNKLRDYFSMDIKATRLNWYRDSSEWKPFHHDAAAIKPDKAKTQNFTVAVSFGAERDAAFEHAKTKTVISMPQPNGTIYTFGKDVNILWRHGILQVPPEKYHQQGRISIIAWGWMPGMIEM